MITSDFRYYIKGKRIIFHYVFISKRNFLWKLLKFDAWFSKSYCGEDYCSVYQYVFVKFKNENEIEKTDFIKMMDDHEIGHILLSLDNATSKQHLLYDLKTCFGLLQPLENITYK